MDETKKVRIGVIGVGTMGGSHARDIPALPNLQLAAICDIDKNRADAVAAQQGVPAYYDYRDMVEKAGLEAVVIATPQYDHTPISIDCLGRGLNVLTEKPLAVHVKDGRKMIAAYEKSRQQFPGQVFAIMFQQRTQGFWRKVKELLDGGELGRLVRATWIITDWFRSQTYYDNGGWRATWSGEGGGVLLNQCPHNLDLYQWFFGLPKRVTGHAAIGKYHNIEVEDEVTGFFEHENGMVGHFITTTAESPGTNRLEIAGELGKLVFEDGKLSLFRNKLSMFEFIRISTSAWDRVEGQLEPLDYPVSKEPGHTVVLQAFANAIRHGGKLVAQAPEGLNSLMLGNAIMLSQFQGKPVELPIDEDAYAALLQELIKTSKFQKVTRPGDMGDVSKSFGIYK